MLMPSMNGHTEPKVILRLMRNVCKEHVTIEMMFQFWSSESGNNLKSYCKHKGPQPLVELSAELKIHSPDVPAAR